jgi:hypothetical protein
MGLKKIEPFFTIPRIVKVGDTDVYSVQVSGFKWSGNFEWIAFLVSTTASLSMDENALCVLSADGKKFQTIDVVLPYSQWFQWAPFPARLGYIAGRGRVIIDPGKELAIRDVIEKEDNFAHGNGLLPMRVWPSSGRPFTFGNNGVDLYVSLDKTYVPTKTPWLDRPHPALYRLILIDDKMIQMTHPPVGWGDVNPHYLMRRRELLFVRTDGKRSDVWICKSDGQGARRWIANIEDDVVIYGERN